VLIKSLTEDRRSTYVLSIDVKTDSESTLIVVLGNQFQTVGTEQRKARRAKSDGDSLLGRQMHGSVLLYLRNDTRYGHTLLWSVNRKPYPGLRMVPFSMILSDP